MVKSAKLMLGENDERLSLLNRDSYLSYLELDYQRRVAEEHKDEVGLYGRIDAPRLVDAQGLPVYSAEDGPTSLNDYLSNRMEHLEQDESILKNIDKEIKQITDSQKNDEAKRKNLKASVDQKNDDSK